MPPAILQKAALDATEGSLLDQPPMVTIQTARLILETVTLDALADVTPMITNPEVMKWTSRLPVKNETEAIQWLSARCLGKDVFNFVIRLKAPASAGTGPSIIGLIGSFHWPSCGYMINPAFSGKGYATEALKAFVPAYFDRVPPVSDDGGHDVLEAFADTENIASHRILEKCGFTKCEVTVADFENPSMGLRDTVAYRLARPGKTLEQLGFARKKEDEEAPPVPPVQ